MNPHAAALLAALQDPKDAASRTCLDGLTPEDWSEVAALAVRKRVGGLLGRRAGQWLPAPTASRLADAGRATAVRTLRFRAELVRLARELEPQGIPLLVLKGLHLATDVYPDAGLREMADVDILVRMDHLSAVDQALRASGFAPFEFTDIRIALLTEHHLPRLVKAGIGVEIHWRLAPEGWPPVVSPDDLWARSVPSPLGAGIRQLSPEDVLIHVCAHATSSHHLDQGLRPICDVAAIVGRHGDALRWDTVGMRAAQWQCARGVALVLALTQRLLGVTLPPAATTALADVWPGEDVLTVADAQVVAASQVSGRVSEAAGRLLVARTLRERIRIISTRLRRPQEDATVLPLGIAPAGRAGQWLYTLKRLGNLLRRYPRQLWRIATEDQSANRDFLARRSAIADWLRGK